MNQWAFVFAAYVVTFVATAGLAIWSYWSMRSAEADVEALKHRQ